MIANLSAASCSLLETGASFFSKLETSGYRLKPKNSQTEISPLRRQLPNHQNLISKPSPNLRRSLDA